MDATDVDESPRRTPRRRRVKFGSFFFSFYHIFCIRNPQQRKLVQHEKDQPQPEEEVEVEVVVVVPEEDVLLPQDEKQQDEKEKEKPKQNKLLVLTFIDF